MNYFENLMTLASKGGVTVEPTTHAKEKPMQIKVQILKENVKLPTYETKGSAGMDLRLHLEDESSIQMEPGDTALCPTGFAIEIPYGYEAQIRPRSGLSLNGILIPNAPGTIDSDYRGEVKVMLKNTTGSTWHLKHGTRIAQMLVTKVERVSLLPSNRLGLTNRGSGGFGSTGDN